MASDPPMRFPMSSCHHTSVSASKGKNDRGFMVPTWTGSTVHMRRANSNGGVLPCMIIGPDGVQMVALVSSSSEPSGSHRGDDACCLLQEIDEAWALYSNALHDL